MPNSEFQIPNFEERAVGDQQPAIGRWYFHAVGLYGLVVFLFSCGYSTRFELPEHIQTVAVPIFGNQTLYRELEYDLTAAVRRELQARSGLVIVEEGKADAELKGEIIDYGIQSLRVNKLNQTTEYAVYIKMDVTFTDLADGKILYQGSRIQVTSTYLVVRGEDELSARREAFAKMARNLIGLAIENW